MPIRRPEPLVGVALALSILALSGLSCSRRSGEEGTAPHPTRPRPPARPLHPVPAIEILPQDRVYFFGVRGESPPRELLLVSHLDHPLTIRGATTDNPLFRAAVQALEAGRRYRLTVSLDPHVPAGKHEGTLRLATDDPARPELEILLRAALDEPVSATPDRVYFGRVRAADLGEPAAAERQVLVVRHRGSGFRVLGARSDLPFLDLTVVRAEGESWLLSVRLVRARAVQGELHGTVVVRTNDAQFPELRLPVIGTVL